MDKILFRRAAAVVSMNDAGDVWRDTDLLVEDGKILRIEPDIVPAADCRVLDASHAFIYPGLINVHHHLYQSFTRNLPQTQGLELFDWLRALYEIWRGMDPDWLYYAALTSLSELLKYGCTTCLDHHYVFPAGQKEELLAAEFRAADELGIRLVACRGSMSLGRSRGGLPPDELVQDLDVVLKDCQAAIARWHDPRPFATRQIMLAPCSPFSVDAELLRASALMAREHGLRLHTHLGETRDEENYCLQKFAKRPLEYLASLGWLGEDVSFAHGIYLNDEELRLLAESGTAIAHCPSSNMKLSSGVLRLPELLELGATVGLAVDGSASNDGSNLLAEIRQAYLLHRLSWHERAPRAAEILRLATRGGAKLLGRDELGRLEVGAAADLFLLDVDSLEFCGATLDAAALPATLPYMKPARWVMVAGRLVCRDGALLCLDEEKKTAEAKRCFANLRLF